MDAAKDLTGLQFGFWIVQRPADPKKSQRHWLVRCTCGAERAVYEGNLVSGKTKSCGCARQRLVKAKFAKRYSLTNQRFGRLLVLWRAGAAVRKDGKGARAIWECKCDCGILVKVKAENLRSGHTKSCGCLQTENRLAEPGVAGFNALLGKYQRAAKERGFVWQLSDEQFKEIVSHPCHYCGTVPSQVSAKQSANGLFLYNGIDRLNNGVGYVLGNVVACCGVHNKMKGTMPHDEFVAQCSKVAIYKNKLTESART